MALRVGAADAAEPIDPLAHLAVTDDVGQTAGTIPGCIKSVVAVEDTGALVNSMAAYSPPIMVVYRQP